MANGGVDHVCRKDGSNCFNDLHRLKFGHFEKCWIQWWYEKGAYGPSSIRPSDVDFIIERKGNILIMEWKSHKDVFDARTGQGRMFRIIPRVSPATIILCEGMASDMSVKSLMVLNSGYVSECFPATLHNLKKICREWSRWADDHRAKELYIEKSKPSWIPAFDNSVPIDGASSGASC